MFEMFVIKIMNSYKYINHSIYIHFVDIIRNLKLNKCAMSHALIIFYQNLHLFKKSA